MIDGLRIAAITANAVIIIDQKGRRHTLTGRFEEQYNE